MYKLSQFKVTLINTISLNRDNKHEKLVLNLILS